MNRLKINNFQTPGFIQDIAPYDSVPEAWNEVKNVRFNSKGAESFSGQISALSPAEINPLWLKVFPPIDNPIWVYGDLTRMFAFNAGHTEITRASGVYNGQLDQRWQGEVFQGLGIFNNVIDIPQLWTVFDSGVKLVDLPNWPATKRCRFLRPFKNYLIAGYIIESGNERPYRILWSDLAAPGTYPASWDPADPTKDADQRDIAETADYIVDGLTMGDFFIVYKQRTAYAMVPIGRPFIFDTSRQILSSRGILWRDCVQAWKGGHFVAGIDDLYVHSGQKGSDQSVVEARLRDWIFNQIDATNFFNCYTVDYRRRNEIWFCFPEAGEIYPTLAAVWNSVTGGIGIRDIMKSPFIYPGPIAPTINAEDDIWDLGEVPIPPAITIPVEYATGSKDVFAPASATSMDLILNNSFLDPIADGVPNAVLLVSVSMETSTTSGIVAPTLTVDGTPMAVQWKLSPPGGITGHEILAMLRIPNGGFSLGTVNISWPSLVTGTSTVKASANVMFNVNASSDAFGDGFLAVDASNTAGTLTVPDGGAVFAVNMQENGGDVVATIQSQSDLVQYTMQSPQVRVTSRRYMTGYRLFATGDPAEILVANTEFGALDFQPVIAVVLKGALE